MSPVTHWDQVGSGCGLALLLLLLWILILWGRSVWLDRKHARETVARWDAFIADHDRKMRDHFGE